MTLSGLPAENLTRGATNRRPPIAATLLCKWLSFEDPFPVLANPVDPQAVLDILVSV
jgi:hypothetical protein